MVRYIFSRRNLCIGGRDRLIVIKYSNRDIRMKREKE